MRSLTVLCGLALATVTATTSAKSIVEAGDYDELTKKFCAADAGAEHILVIPATLYADQKAIECESGTFGLRTTEPKDDPGHVVYNIDPPHGQENALDCDGKADTGMGVIALNCFPVSKEAAAHRKE